MHVKTDRTADINKKRSPSLLGNINYIPADARLHAIFFIRDNVKMELDLSLIFS